MNNKLRPNFTQIPNYFLDEIYKDLTVYEITALIFICRKIYGWHKIGNKDKISYSQFMKNTPLKRNSLVKALEGLEKKEIILTFKQHRKTTEYTLNLDRVCEINSTGLSDKPKKVKSSLSDKHTKESNINKLVKENIDATHLEKHNNNFSIYSETIKVFHVGYKAITGKEWNWSKKKAPKNGQQVKDLIEIATYEYKKIENKEEREEKTFHEICRRAKILFRLIKARDKFYGKIEFLPGKLGYFWDDLVVDKRELTKREVQENSLADSVASVTKFLKKRYR